jgi:imidazole glycerol phosphate synthase glutamine amidotransferase subunit
MEQIKKSKLDRIVTDWIKNNKSFLGICVGLQMLLESSEESPEIKGLSVIEGTNRRFNTHKVPQMGWNNLRIKQPSPLFSGIQDGSFFYFIHSFYAEPEDPNVILSETDYGVTYTSTVQTGNAYAVQFHPEKSGKAGLQLLKNWVEQC